MPRRRHFVTACACALALDLVAGGARAQSATGDAGAAESEPAASDASAGAAAGASANVEASASASANVEASASASPGVSATAPCVPAAVGHGAMDPDAIPPGVREAARRLFTEGVNLVNGRQYEQARDRFCRTLALIPSPSVRYNLAYASYNAGHLVEAIDQYRQFLLEDSDPANVRRRDEAQNAIAAMEPLLSVVTVEVQGNEHPAHVRIDGQDLPLALVTNHVPLPLDPGDHLFEADGEHGARAIRALRLAERVNATITLVLNAAREGAAGPVSRTPPPPEPEPPTTGVATRGTVERVRRAIDERAAATDVYGRRRWERTIVAESFTSTGNPVGVLGISVRWAARPFFEVELEGGAFHRFGAGIGAFITLRYPWSYRYGPGIMLGVSTNLTEIPRGSADEAHPTCRDTSPFTPVWLMAAITHEWRVSLGFTFRLGLGIRYLANHRELDETLDTHCLHASTTLQPYELFIDRPDSNHAATYYILPWIAFGVGYSI